MLVRPLSLSPRKPLAIFYLSLFLSRSRVRLYKLQFPSRHYPLLIIIIIVIVARAFTTRTWSSCSATWRSAGRWRPCRRACRLSGCCQTAPAWAVAAGTLAMALGSTSTLQTTSLKTTRLPTTRCRSTGWTCWSPGRILAAGPGHRFSPERFI